MEDSLDSELRSRVVDMKDGASMERQALVEG